MSSAPETPQPATKEIRENLSDKADQLAYSLHFHSVAHYLSAARYDRIDRWMTYGTILLGAVTAANIGSVVNDVRNKEGSFNVPLTMLSSTSAVIIAALNALKRTDHSPKIKKERHQIAGSKHKELEKKVEVWGKSSAIDPTKSTDELRQEFNEFLTVMKQIKEVNITSEDWTFPHVHEQLGSKWKAIKEDDDKKKK